MKLSDIIYARRIFLGITEKLPFKTSYKIAQFMKATDTENTLWEEKSKEILEKYPENEQSEECSKELTELGNQEVNEVSVKFEESDLESLQFTPAQVFFLMPFITGE